MNRQFVSNVSQMRRINPSRFRVATRGTSREINSQIVLNLVRAHQPISRADLARTMGVSRGAVTLIVNDLLERTLIFEGATGETVRGRKPTFLYIDSRRRAVVAVDIRASETFLMLADLLGKPLDRRDRRSRPSRDPKALVAALAARIKALLAEHPDVDACEGIGVVVPGMVEHSTMRVLHAPTLGWRDVNLREPLAAATGLPVQIENSGRACALAQMWALRGDAAATPRRPRVRQRLGRRRRRRDHERRGAARAAQHRRRVRPRAAVARRPALFVRLERLLGGLRLEPRDAGALLRPAARDRAGPEDAAARALHHRRPDRARARRRRQGGGGHRGHGALSRPRPRVGDQRARSRPASTSAARSRWPGISSKAPCARRWPSAR